MEFKELTEEELKQVNGGVVKISATLDDQAAGLGYGNKSSVIVEIYRKTQR